MPKQRLDVLLVDKGFFPSRERARSAIMAGRVIVAGKKVDKAGTPVLETEKIELIGQDLPFVSRGGLKLQKAIQKFNLDLTDVVMADIGASTGGFTDCALQQGAAKVFAIDVGYGQLAWSLRQDPRVINMERTNVRYVTVEQLGEKMDFISIDVAFISLDKVLPVAKELLKQTGQIVALIKPQFEAGREKVGKKGVVKDPAIHCEVIEKILSLAKELELHVLGLTFSPVKGPEGNIEYLIWLTPAPQSAETVFDVRELVRAAHEDLSRPAPEE